MKDTRRGVMANGLLAAGLALVLVGLFALSVAASKPAELDGAHGLSKSGKPTLDAALAPVSVVGRAAPPDPTAPASILALIYAPSDLAQTGKMSFTQEGTQLTRPPNVDETLAARLGLETASFAFSPLGELAPAFSMDWGDVDRDGDMDLALGSPDGVAVYINNGRGELVERWRNSIYTLGVRWADLDQSNANLELVAVGDSTDATPVGQGRIYIYLDAASARPVIQSVQPGFDAPQLLRVAPADYDNDGDVDLVLSTNALAAPCPVLMCRNDGARRFDCSHCVSYEATASLSAADFNNDTFMDLALGKYESKQIKIVVNDAGALAENDNSILVATALAHIPYDLVWGDYDSDGWLDLAAAFPLDQEVRIYRNERGAFTPTGSPLTVRTDALLSPLVIDWADFTGNGRLELAVGDSPPRIYGYDKSSGFVKLAGLVSLTGRIQGIRGIELDGDGDVDLAVANLYGLGQTFRTEASLFSPDITVVGPNDAFSSAWGDYNADGWLDLAAAIAGDQGGGRIYRNNKDGSFTSVWSSSGNVKALAWGDYDGDGWLDLATAVGAQGSRIYRNNKDGSFSLIWSSPPGDAWRVAWSDYDDNQCLDLTVANGAQGVWAYRNSANGDGCSGDFSPVKIAAIADARDIAWGDYDRDYHLDLAVASGAGGAVVYHNNRNATFSRAWQADAAESRSVAWADYNGDGWLDLAVANGAQGAWVYRNNGKNAANAFTSTWSNASADAQGAAWGDYNGDGWPDLAIANGEQGACIFRNSEGALDSNPVWVKESGDTRHVAWGDKNHDGDLDLALSTVADLGVGIVENNLVLPAHLSRRYVPLPRNASYAAIARPGQTRDAYFFSSPEILAGRDSTGVVQVPFTLYNPDNGRSTLIKPKPIYEFSLNDGGTWQPAHAVAGSIQPTGEATRQGTDKVFLWDARGDGAISDNARIRITMIDQAATGPVLRASGSATSPPFRVRALMCAWPAGAVISIIDPLPPTKPSAGDLVRFLGSLDEGDGTLIFDWDFGDPYSPITKTAQLVHHRFMQAGAYTVTLRVRGQPCPATKEIVTSKVVTVETVLTASAIDGARSLPTIYLPLTLSPGPRAGAGDSSRPAQITSLAGLVQSDAGSTKLSWPLLPATESVVGYRIYRGDPGTTSNSFELLNTVSAVTQTYSDLAADCGQMYYVAAFNAGGESLPSMASYFSPRCP